MRTTVILSKVVNHTTSSSHFVEPGLNEQTLATPSPKSTRFGPDIHRGVRFLGMLITAAGLLACASSSGSPIQAPLAKLDAGSFWMGSDLGERSQAIEHLKNTQTKLTPDAYRWLNQEKTRHSHKTQSFRIMRYAVTHLQYYQFVQATGHPAPSVGPENWERMDTGFDYLDVIPHLWTKGRPDEQQLRRPVVLVNADQAQRFCLWWGSKLGGHGRLPSEAQWERAARGDEGFIYPWGNDYRSQAINDREFGPGHSTPVAAYVRNRSPHGVYGMAGNVLEWTSTIPESGDERQRVVKGGAYNISGAMARAAARDFRFAAQRHPVLGFRCVLQGV